MKKGKDVRVISSCFFSEKEKRKKEKIKAVKILNLD
jgi:hypothetical protein